MVFHLHGAGDDDLLGTDAHVTLFGAELLTAELHNTAGLDFQALGTADLATEAMFWLLVMRVVVATFS